MSYPEIWAKAARRPNWRLNQGTMMLHLDAGQPWWSTPYSYPHRCWEQTHLCGFRDARGAFICISRCPCGAWQEVPAGGAHPYRWSHREP